jgi:hypothetical protein
MTAVKLLADKEPKGLYYTRLNGQFYGIDNTGADPLVLEFKTVLEFMTWAANEAAKLDINLIQDTEGLAEMLQKMADYGEAEKNG